MLLDRYGEIELSSPDAARWLAEHFAAAEHPGLAGRAGRRVAGAAAVPVAGQRAHGRRLTVRLQTGDPHALLLEEKVASVGTDALDRLGLTARETEVLPAATVMEGGRLTVIS